MTKQTIEVDVKPATGYKCIQEPVDWISDDTAIIKLRFEKIQPRRIGIEETEEDNRIYLDGYFYTQSFDNGTLLLYNQPKVWREVKETDLALNKAEPKLELTVDKCRELVKYGMSDSQVVREIREFIKAKNETSAMR